MFEIFLPYVSVILVFSAGVLIPGPSLLVIITRTFTYGRFNGLVTSLGVCLASIIHALYINFGLAAFIADYPLRFKIFQGLAFFILLYFSFSFYRSSKEVSLLSTLEIEKKEAARKYFPFFFSGLWIGLINPFTVLFLMGLIATIPPLDKWWIIDVAFSFAIGAFDFLVLSVFICLLTRPKWMDYLSSKASLFNKIASIIMLFFAVRMLFP